MADEARELLKRLVKWHTSDDPTGQEFIVNILTAARAFLAREQDGPVAEGWPKAPSAEDYDIEIEQNTEVTKTMFDGTNGSRYRRRARIELARLLKERAERFPDSIVGSVVEPHEDSNIGPLLRDIHGDSKPKERHDS